MEDEYNKIDGLYITKSGETYFKHKCYNPNRDGIDISFYSTDSYSLRFEYLVREKYFNEEGEEQDDSEFIVFAENNVISLYDEEIDEFLNMIGLKNKETGIDIRKFNIIDDKISKTSKNNKRKNNKENNNTIKW